MDEDPTPAGTMRRFAWLTPAAGAIGVASFLSDVGHEVPTSLLPSFLTATLGAPASALGLIEGVADGVAGVAKLAGGALADDPHRRRATAIGGYTTTAVLSSAIGLATAPLQVGILRAGAWAARGIRGPARNALLADVVEPEAYGRAYGFERAMDNFGAIVGPLLALLLVSFIGVRQAILVSIVPGLLAAVAIYYAARHVTRPTTREHRPVRLQVRPVLKGRLGRLFIGMGAFEFGNAAATLMILRATELLTPSRGEHAAAQIALLLYVGYNVSATLASLPGGHLSDRRSAVHSLLVGAAAFLAAYLIFASAGPRILVLLAAFVLARCWDRLRGDRRGRCRRDVGRRVDPRLGLRSPRGRSEPGQLRRERHRGDPVDRGVANCGVPLVIGVDGDRAHSLPRNADTSIASEPVDHRLPHYVARRKYVNM